MNRPTATEHRFEGAGVTVGVVGDEPHVGASLLGLSPPLAGGDALSAGSGGAGDHPVGVEHDRRRGEVDTRGDDRPVRAPHRDDAPLHVLIGAPSIRATSRSR